MLKVTFLLYRDWGYRIYRNIKEYEKIRGDFKLTPVIAGKNHEFKAPKNAIIVDPNDTEKIYKTLKKLKPDWVLAYSWNSFIREPILSEFKCMCLHPSLVPENRGGTPIQNQILKGIENSGISIFRMDNGMDTGPVYAQASMSLIGDVNDIFARMIDLGTILTRKMISDCINGSFKLKKQKNPTRFPPLKRRKPQESEINLEKLPKTTFDELNNLVRGLLQPYPNAFFIKNGKKYLIRHVEKYPSKPKGLSFKLKDGWAKVVDYKTG